MGGLFGSISKEYAPIAGMAAVIIKRLLISFWV